MTLAGRDLRAISELAEGWQRVVNSRRKVGLPDEGKEPQLRFSWNFVSTLRHPGSRCDRLGDAIRRRARDT
jgi:hypothetical protein